MGKVRDLTGQRFGKLTVIEPIGKDKHTNVIWHCLCDCGNYHDAVSRSLVNGGCKSCGCLNVGKYRGKVRDNSLRANFELNWLLNKQWITNLSLKRI